MDSHDANCEKHIPICPCSTYTRIPEIRVSCLFRNAYTDIGCLPFFLPNTLRIIIQANSFPFCVKVFNSNQTGLNLN